MIPKKIHYCWFSNEPFPEQVQQCIASWKQYMPDWEYVLWNYDRIKDIDSIWLKECLAAKKWAFAADFVRLWAVYHDGGIYLDSDVLLYQSLEPFLNDCFFTGREGVFYPTFDDGVQVFLSSHCFGAEAGHPFLKLNLEYYQGRHFEGSISANIPNILRYDMTMLPYIQSRLAEMYGYDPAYGTDHIQRLKEGMVIYPSSYFGKDKLAIETTDCFAKHIGHSSWREPEYWQKHPKQISIDFKYKIRWRLVSVLKNLAKRLDYIMIRIHPDGLE